MIEKFKRYAIVIGSLILAILTLGGYARYQKRRADTLKQQAEEDRRIAEYAQAIHNKITDTRYENIQRLENAESAIKARNYFDNYDN